MFLVILIVAAIGVIVFFKMKSDPKELKKLYKDRTPDQKDAIRYFMAQGCLKKKLSDSDYDKLVRRKVDSLNLRAKAINKIGLDEDEIKAWIFASDKQLYVYSYQFNLDEDGKRERTEEYFWKDITNFSTITETREVGVDWDSKKGEYTSRKNIDTQDFAIVVPGDKYICAARQDESVETAIRAMKAKLREKKNA